MRPEAALFLFHLRVGTRVALRILAPVLAAGLFLFYVLRPEFALELARIFFIEGGLVESGLAGTLLLVGLARVVAPRVSAGGRGWARSLPVAGTALRLLAALSMVVAEIPTRAFLGALVLASTRPGLPGAAIRVAGLVVGARRPGWPFCRRLPRCGQGFSRRGVLLPTSIIEPPISWNSIINSGNGMAIPVSDPQALFTLSLYMSDGGQFVNANGMPGLDEVLLIRVLTFYQRTIESGVLPLTAREFKTDKDVLNYYHTGGADLVVIRASSDMQIWSGEYIILLGLDDAPYAIGDGWVWALAGSNVENQPLAVELASYLVDCKFMSEWTLASGVFPTRPQAVDLWGDQLLKFSVNEILRAAHPIPSDDVVSIVGPLLQGALARVFNGEQPEVVTRSVVENLK